MSQTAPGSTPDTPALFRLAFRPLFLLGAGFTVLAIALWAAHLNGFLTLAPYGGPLFWHIHEMLYGFIAAIVVGFLLTAAGNWTGIPTVRGYPLMGLVTLWLVARLNALFDWLPGGLHALLDCGFPVMAAVFLGRVLLQVKQYRNLFFVPLLLVLAAGSGLMHGAVLADLPDLMTAGYTLGLGVVIIMITVLGGRVIPVFTANGTQTPKVPNAKPLELILFALMLSLTAIWLLSWTTPISPVLVGTLLLATGLVQLIRWWRWRFWITARIPLLWSLHAAYLFVPLGLLGLGGYFLEWLPQRSANLHLLTTGGMGGMILAMTSRVALGHTGRPLKAPPSLAWAYGLLLAGSILRGGATQLWPALHLQWVNLTSLCWVLAFGIFTLRYAPWLCRPRVDGGPG